ADLFYRTRPHWLAFSAKTLIGIWHGLLQLLVPFVLIRHGSWLTWVIAAVLVLVPFGPLGIYLLKRNSRLGLPAVWVVYGTLLLVLPWLTSQPSPIAPAGAPAIFFDSMVWRGFYGMLPSLIAGVAGAVICCLWFGWYLAVCFVFNGHNNEIGGAARIERFKQFIRFRLTENTLTGYVIAVD